MYAVDPSLWVGIASMYLEGSAARWYQSIENTPITACWTSFCKSLHDRFDRDQHESLIRKLFHVKQTSTVLEYIERFSDLVDQLIAYSTATDPLYYTIGFIDGLRSELKAMIRVSRPQNLNAAVAMALVQEEVGGPSSFRMPGRGDWSSSSKYSPRTALPLPPHPRVDRAVPLPPPPHQQPEVPPASTVSTLASVKAYRRSLGLCYKCSAKWSKDHRCSLEILNAVEALWESLSVEDDAVDSPPVDTVAE